MPAVTVVVLTMGDRPGELVKAIESARAQRGDVEVVLVVNGGNPERSLADIVVEPCENLGIPEGRNVGATAGSGELICFLDDDGRLEGDVFGSAIDAFALDDRLSVIGLHVVDETGASARRHIPGLLKKADRSVPATAFPGGACILRRSAFEKVGGLCGPFRYGLEETDLAWRLIDEGWGVEYRADLRVVHPRTSPTRHPEFFFRTARNRVWLAHRSLPLPLALLYVLNWTLVTTLRSLRQPSEIFAHMQGLFAGLRSCPGPRRPMRWRTALELTRRGRPPLI